MTPTPAIRAAAEPVQMSPRAPRWATMLLLAAAMVMFAAHARVYWQWTEDDAFISLRYAQNLSQGHGLAFNPGERVEGYSNFSWVILATLVMRLGGDAIAAVKIAGFLSGLGCLLLSWVLARRMLPQAGLLALLAPWYLAVSPVLVQHSIAGLESSFFALLLLASVVLATAPQSSRLAGRMLLVALLWLLSLTRPEGVGLAIVVLACRAWWQRGNVAQRVDWIAFALLFGGWFVWRWNYFGLLFPNTFYAKAQGGLHSVIDGTQYVLDFLRDGGGPLFFGMALAPLLLGRARPAVWMSVVVLLAYVVFIVVAGGDWMWNYRFLAHVLPILAALVAAGFASVLEEVTARSWRTLGLYAGLALLLLVTFLSMGNTELRVARIVLPALRAHNYLSQNYEELGLWFREHTPPDASLAISDVGAVAYFSERRIIDMFGLNDKHIAGIRGRMHYKSDPGYVLEQRPDYIVLVSLNDQGDGYSFQRIPDYAMNALPAFHDQYNLVRTVPQHWNNEYVLIYKRGSLGDQEEPR